MTTPKAHKNLIGIDCGKKTYCNMISADLKDKDKDL